MSALQGAPARTPVRWSLEDGTCEALKWIAFAAMLVDHANIVFLDRSADWMFQVGRVAMPIFAVVFGYNLARSRDPDAVIRRMILAGLLVQPLAVWTINRGELLPLNILLTFAAGASLVRAADRGRMVQLAVLLVVSVAAMDYTILGPLLVAVSWRYFRDRGDAAFALLCLLAAALAMLNASPWTLLGFAAVFAAGWVRIELPRAHGALLWLYGGHLGAFGLLRLVQS